MPEIRLTISRLPAERDPQGNHLRITLEGGYFATQMTDPFVQQAIARALGREGYVSGAYNPRTKRLEVGLNHGPRLTYADATRFANALPGAIRREARGYHVAVVNDVSP